MPLPRITRDDVRQLPDDGDRYEAIEGALYVAPGPSVRHQAISLRLVPDLFRILVGDERMGRDPARIFTAN